MLLYVVRLYGHDGYVQKNRQTHNIYLCTIITSAQPSISSNYMHIQHRRTHMHTYIRMDACTQACARTHAPEYHALTLFTSRYLSMQDSKKDRSIDRKICTLQKDESIDRTIRRLLPAPCTFVLQKWHYFECLWCAHNSPPELIDRHKQRYVVELKFRKNERGDETREVL